MTKYTGTFVHLAEITYQFEVEAESEEEARNIIEDDGFWYLKEDEPLDEAWLEIKDIEFDEE